MENLSLWIRAKSHALVISPTIQKAAHTFWQAGLAYLVVSVQVNHVPLHTLGDGKVLLAGALGAALSALKTFVISYWQAYKG